MKILFVDDKPVTHANFRDQLQKDNRFNDYTIELAFDLSDAIDFLNQELSEIKAVIIDLHLPNDIPAELNQYYRQHAREMQLNEGQLLGLYLCDKNKPYFYLSAYSGKCREEWENKPAPVCLDKEVSAKTFLDALDELLKNSGHD